MRLRDVIFCLMPVWAWATRPRCLRHLTICARKQVPACVLEKE